MHQLKTSVNGSQPQAIRKGVTRTTGNTDLLQDRWDADPLLPSHVAEWVKGSACHPQLAAANLESLQGEAVLEVLLGERSERLGGHAFQYATSEVQRLLRPLEGPAAAGGWWCTGLDPLADWQPMAWGCFKPDAPRIASSGKPIKYEHPQSETRSFWLRVPGEVACLVIDRWQSMKPVPTEVMLDETGRSGAFWSWWAEAKDLPLVITEGAKKAGALLSAGIPAVALPGIWNGTPKAKDAEGQRTGKPELLADFRPELINGRRCIVLFDWSDSEKGRRAVAQAARRLGSALKKAGAAEVQVGVCPGPEKGADDFLAAGGTWEQLEAELEVLKAPPVLPRLRPADERSTAGWLSDAVTIPSPEKAELVALRAPMGCGKTTLVAQALKQRRATDPNPPRVLALTHRLSLCSKLADEFELRCADAPLKAGEEGKTYGQALCVDSLCASSAVRFNPRDWRGAVVVIDEADQVLRHLLMAEGTTVAQRRVAVLRNLQQVLSEASQVVIASAQLDDTVLKVFEGLCDSRAYLIRSEHQPAAGRVLVNHESRETWRFALVDHLQRQQRIWITTSAQQAGMANSAQNLAREVLEHWPKARVLVVDAETMADEGHDASRFAAEPVAMASVYDVVISTPAISSGLSIDAEALPGHFAAVFSWSGGTMDAVSLVQAMGRVRDGCPRHLCTAERSPGGALRVGSGAINWGQLLAHLGQHSRLVAQMLAAANWQPELEGTGPWLKTWAKFAAAQNRIRLAYRATVLGLLELEGYAIQTAAPLSSDQTKEAKAIGDRLRDHAKAAQLEADQRLLATPLISDEEANQLKEEKRQLSSAERAKLRRWGVAQAWGLKEAEPTPELIEAHREGLHRRLRFRWLLQTDGAIGALQAVDERKLRPGTVFAGRFNEERSNPLTGPVPVQTVFEPDICQITEAPRVRLAKALQLDWWSQRTDWFTWQNGEQSGSNDPALQRLAEQLKTYGPVIAQVLGVEVSPTAKATTGLRQLLALVGCKLEAKRRRTGANTRAYAYRVVAMEAPAGADPDAMAHSWATQLGLIEEERPNVYEANRASVFEQLDQGLQPEQIPLATSLLGRGWVAAWRRLRGVARNACPKKTHNGVGDGKNRDTSPAAYGRPAPGEVNPRR